LQNLKIRLAFGVAVPVIRHLLTRPKVTVKTVRHRGLADHGR
jgi:hypothetical protein